MVKEFKEITSAAIVRHQTRYPKRSVFVEWNGGTPKIRTINKYRYDKLRKKVNKAIIKGSSRGKFSCKLYIWFLFISKSEFDTVIRTLERELTHQGYHVTEENILPTSVYLDISWYN